MPRYIDADKLCEALKSMARVQYPDKQNTILGVVSSIENFPTADVVPKSEVDRLGKKYNELLELKLANAKTEVVREIFEEIKKIDEDTATFQEFHTQIMILKEIYTEE